MGSEPDAILVTLARPRTGGAARPLWREPRAAPPPIVVLIAASDPDAPAAALALGADDALAAPVHLPELCARLHARIRDRQYPRGTPREGAVRRALERLVGEGRDGLRPDEVVLALVRRLARAFDLARCSFVAIEPGDGERPRGRGRGTGAGRDRAGRARWISTEHGEVAGGHPAAAYSPAGPTGR